MALYDGKLYHYTAFVRSVYDGDSITVDIDLGFGVKLEKQKIRLYGIDAPEVKGEERPIGLIARNWLRSQIDQKTIIIKTIKDRKGKYGRWLGMIYTKENTLISLNRDLVRLGYAVEVEY